ncbi:ECF transporter S component [bacterium]|nr:ECF transporter S component [bacterium]
MNTKNRLIARLALLIALTLVIQAMGLPQPVTGPLINALLFLTTGLLGPLAGIMLGIITPVVALIRGQLPSILAPMVPFIAIGNAALVIIYSLIGRIILSRIHKQWAVFLPIVFASFGKFCVLLLSVRIIVPVMLGRHFPPKIELIMALPQLLTALGGGILFLLMRRIFSKIDLDLAN